jgi:iron-sulfur cluster repair protein YtfE (RIC family)
MFPHTRHKLADLKTHAERADWLARAGEGVFATEAGTLRAAMEAAKFAAGVQFIEARYHAAWADRLGDGSLPATVVIKVEAARGAMLAEVKGDAG